MFVRVVGRAIVVGLACVPCGFAADAPRTYLLDYPVTRQFVPPVAGFFEEAGSTIGRVGRRTFRHQPNGGYGLAIRERVEGKHLLHLGADVGWYRVGEPVVAVADGVVRLVQRPSVKDEAKDARRRASGTAWGGLVAIEHHLPDESYVTTIYGHLDTELLVSLGDVVKAGQPIGTIGTARVNGGYKPHLHFGIRDGRMAEVGRKLVTVRINGRDATLTIRKLTEETVELAGAKELPDGMQLGLDGRSFELNKSEGGGGGGAEVSAEILWHLLPADFAIVGYGLSTKGWRDPVAFLRERVGE